MSDHGVQAETFESIAAVIAGYFADGWRGGIIAAGLVLGTVIALLVVAAFIAARRLPVNIEVDADPTIENNYRTTGYVRVASSGKSQFTSGYIGSKLTVNTFGHHDYRVTKLWAECRRMKLGAIPQTVYIINCDQLDKPVGGPVDWLLPAVGHPETKTVWFTAYQPSENKASPGDLLDVRIVAEFGSPHRRIYKQFPEQIVVRGHLLDHPRGDLFPRYAKKSLNTHREGEDVGRC